MYVLEKLSVYRELSQLRKNVLSGSIAAGGNMLLILIAYPIYLKYLGVEQYGLWATLSVVVFFSQLGELGVSSALIKYVAAEFGGNNYDGITQYTTTAFCIIIVPFSLIILLLYLFKGQIVGFLELKNIYVDVAKQLIPLMGFLAVFIMVVELAKGVIMGIGRMDIANYVFLLGRVSQVLTSVVLVIYGLKIWGLYLGAAFAYGVIFILYIYILCVHYKIRLFKVNRFAKKCFYDLLAFGGVLFSARLIKMLVQPFNKIIITKYIGLSEVTYYELATKAALGLRSFYDIGLKAIMPKVSELQRKSNDAKRAIKHIYKQSVKFIVFFAMPVFCMLFILANYVLLVWLGERYDPKIAMALRWFVLAYLINLFSVPCYYICMGTNKVQYCFYSASLRSLLVSGIIVSFIIIGTPLSLRMVVAIDALAIVVGAVFLITMYHILDKKAIAPVIKDGA
jgi:O-antigen/teichoic acid export membrane protein